MRSTLMVSLLLVSISLTAMSVLLVRWSVERQIRRGLDADLEHSLTTFRNLSEQRNELLSREAGLLADLPSLKALMATGDQRTISDGGDEFGELSGSDFFSLASPEGSLYTFRNRGSPADGQSISAGLHDCLDSLPQSCFLSSDHRLYVLATRSIYFGPTAQRSHLGYVTIGYAVDGRVAHSVSEVASADVLFLVGGRLAASTLGASLVPELLTANQLRPVAGVSRSVRLGRESYVARAALLGLAGGAEVKVVALKSYDQASLYLQTLNRWMEGLGLLVLIFGSSLVVVTARSVTRPLERLVEGTRALGKGDFSFRLGSGGAAEVRELGSAFEQMRDQLRTKQAELVESERLATIGRMASSVSHDLRHHLSAIYASAEFMSLPKTVESEREELLSEVQEAVQQMTDLIESLLLFGRTGQMLHRSFDSVSALVARTASMIRRHPEARHVDLLLMTDVEGEAWIDTRSLGRAIFNLLLNACQAAKTGGSAARVTVSVFDHPDAVVIRVEDNGPGVSPSIRKTLFQPFVSASKANGVGLGLTLAHHIALEHGGEVRLEESQNLLTRFDLLLYRSAWKHIDPTADQPSRNEAAGHMDQAFAARPNPL